MNPKIFLGLLIIIFIPVVSAATLSTYNGNFSDGFETGSFNSSVWSLSTTGTGAFNWTVNTVTPASGIYAAQDIGRSASQAGILTLNMSTTNYSNITLKYQKRNINFLVASSLATIQYFDGTSWTTLNSSSATDAAYVNMSFNLPTTANNNPSMQIRWTCLSGTITSRYCLVDNVRVTGIIYNATIQPIPSANLNYSITNASNGVNIHIAVSNNGTTINTNLTTSTKTTYDYVGRGIYEANFKNLISTTGVISITRGIELQYQPNGIYWGSSNVDTTIDANPSGVATVNGSSIYWTDAYVPGVSIKYTYMPTELKEYLIINNRTNIGNPSISTLAGQNISFKQQFVINNINSADLFIDSDTTPWTTIGTRVATKGVFKYNGVNVFTLHTPYAYDSAGHNITGWYTFVRNGVSLYVEMNIPFEYMNATTTQYPVIIDPTTSIDLNGTLIINLSDQTYNPLQQITLSEVRGEGDVLIDTQITQEGVRYAINPVGLDFNTGHADVKSAIGNQLLKCVNWDYVNEVCGNDTDSSWMLVETLIPNNSYDFNFTNTDPAYAETTLAATEQSVASGSVGTAVTKTFTPSVAGYYLIFGTGLATVTATNRNVQTDARLDDTIFATHILRPHDASRLNDYPSFSFMGVKYLNTSSHTVNVTFQPVGTATTAYTRDVSVNVLYLYPQSNFTNVTAQSSLSTTLTTYATMNLTNVPFTADYMIYAYAEVSSSSNAFSNTIYLQQDAVILDDVVRTMAVAGEYISVIMSSRVSLTEGQNYSFTIRARNANGVVGLIKNMVLVAIPVESDYDFQYNENNTQTNSTSTTPTNITRISFQPAYPGTYIISATAQMLETSLSGTTMINVSVNGVSQCYALREPNQVADWAPYGCIIPYNFTNTTNNITVLLSRSPQATGTASIKDAKLAIYAVNTTLNTCEYTGSGLWAFLVNRYCRIFHRTLGDSSGINIANLNTTESGVIIKGFNEFNVSNSSTFTIDSGTNITIGNYT